MIEVDVPEGWKAVGYKVPKKGEYFYDIGDSEPIKASNNMSSGWLVVEKIQTREITLVETDEKLGEDEFHVQYITLGDDFFKITSNKVWKIKETK
jgi:hypothetical protein